MVINTVTFMNWLKSTLWKFWLSGLVTAPIAGVVIFLFSYASLAETISKNSTADAYQPPSGIGRPNAEGVDQGGTRGNKNSPLLLTPKDYFGVTVSPYPTFLVYIPANIGENEGDVKYVEFVLADSKGEEIYKSDFQIALSDKIVSISLPERSGLAALKVGEDYQWSFSIYDDASRLNEDSKAKGSIRRVELKPELANQLKNVSALAKVKIYARSGIWYDAVATMAQLYRDNPADRTIKAEWEALLSDDDIALKELNGASLFSH